MHALPFYNQVDWPRVIVDVPRPKRSDGIFQVFHTRAMAEMANQTALMLRVDAIKQALGQLSWVQAPGQVTMNILREADRCRAFLSAKEES